MPRPPVATTRRRLLRIYLNDHLAGAEVVVRVARRCLASNRASPLGDFLADLLTEVAEDRAALEQLIDALELPRARIKVAAAAAAELTARLKLNGRWTGYSDLSRLEELDGLLAGIALKQRMWQSLQHVAGAHPALEQADLGRLIERAASQVERLEKHRLEAAARAFG